MYFLNKSPTPLEKSGDLTSKGAPLIFKFSKPPSTFETPKVQPPFQREEGVRAMLYTYKELLRSVSYL